MKRRTLLKTALALPMTQATALAPAARETSSTREDDSAALFSGLPGLDYALGGIRTGELICIAGLPSTGKTLLLMDLAARICGRYGKNVVFYSAHQPSVYLGKKGTIKAGVRFGFADVRLLADNQDREFDWRPAVILLDSTAATLTEAIHVAQRTETEHPARCAGLLVDQERHANDRRKAGICIWMKCRRAMERNRCSWNCAMRMQARNGNRLYARRCCGTAGTIRGSW